jgi:hypothetical protein
MMPDDNVRKNLFVWLALPAGLESASRVRLRACRTARGHAFHPYR